jgi:hypothetical protein
MWIWNAIGLDQVKNVFGLVLLEGFVLLDDAEIIQIYFKFGHRELSFELVFFRFKPLDVFSPDLPPLVDFWFDFELVSLV